MTIKKRIKNLERTQPATPANPYMTMPREVFINLIVEKMEAAQRGEGQPVDLSKAGEAMRAEILQRLARIAEERNEHKKAT